MKHFYEPGWQVFITFKWKIQSDRLAFSQYQYSDRIVFKNSYSTFCFRYWKFICKCSCESHVPFQHVRWWVVVNNKCKWFKIIQREIKFFLINFDWQWNSVCFCCRRPCRCFLMASFFLYHDETQMKSMI